MTEPQGERLFPREDGPARLLDWKNVQEALYQAGRVKEEFLILANALTHGPSSEGVYEALEGLRRLRIEEWDAVPDDIREKVESAYKALEPYAAQAATADAEEINRILKLYPQVFRLGDRNASPLKEVEAHHETGTSTLLVGHLYNGEFISIGNQRSIFIDITKLSDDDQLAIEAYIQAHELGL